jgi:RimJ/RimL family protein N-acetyltransferase
VIPQGWRFVETDRLSLRPAGEDDLEAMARLHGDVRVWQHRPEGRHTSVEQTAEFLNELEAQWDRDGIGYWVAALRVAVAGVAAGTVAGIGGCALSPRTGCWNVYYRLFPELQGHGLATELCRTGIDAARTFDPQLPVLALLLEHNVASKGTAERAGLTLAWRGSASGGTDPDAQRLIYADRPLNSEEITTLAALI